MNAARRNILSTIRTSLGRTELNEERRAALEKRLKRPVSNVIPARGQGPRNALAERFVTEACKVDATSERIGDISDIPAAVLRYLMVSKGFTAPQNIKAAPQSSLKGLPWSKHLNTKIAFGAASPDDIVSLAVANAGVAETGTLVMASSPTCPISLHFLAEVQIIVVAARDIVGSYEEVWKLLRSQNEQNPFMPRSINLITGPSRTADIEQTLLLGAHGPKNLHILVLSDG
jgi:L-lactate dehydrogenase complex protein LldG